MSAKRLLFLSFLLLLGACIEPPTGLATRPRTPDPVVDTMPGQPPLATSVRR